MKRAISIAVALLLLNSAGHAALRNGPRPTTPTNPAPTTPTWPITGGGSPTTTCLIYPLSCVQ